MDVLGDFYKETAIVLLTLFLVMVIISGIPHQLTGFATNLVSEKRAEKQNDSERIIFYQSIHDAEKFKQCQESLSICQNSLLDLKKLFFEHCEKPNKPFELVAFEIANSYNYSENFDCDDFSKVLYERLEKIGYKARIVHGTYKGEPHTWVVVEIPIEATNGNIITPKEYAFYESTEK